MFEVTNITKFDVKYRFGDKQKEACIPSKIFGEVTLTLTKLA